MNKILSSIKKLGGCVYRPTEALLKNGATRRRTLYAYYYKYLPVKENVILYESFFGRGLLCNPYAFFLELISNKEYKNYIHVWVIEDFESNQAIINTYSTNKNIKFIRYGSREYLKYLCSAKYLINNFTFPSYFTKKAGQIYINTWHGIPLKTLGFDTPNGNVEVTNVLRNFLHTDYLISASSFLTDIYKKIFRFALTI